METFQQRLFGGPDPGSLSPEQLEQLRDFKVRLPVLIKVRLLRTKVPRRRTPGRAEQGLFLEINARGLWSIPEPKREKNQVGVWPSKELTGSAAQLVGASMLA